MKITNFDTDIILALIDLDMRKRGGGTTTDLAKLLFSPEDDYELRKRDSAIRYRLERLRKKDIVTKDNGNSKYQVNPERVFLTRAAMHLEDMHVDLGMGHMLVIYPKNDDVMMRQISFKNSS